MRFPHIIDSLRSRRMAKQGVGEGLRGNRRLGVRGGGIRQQLIRLRLIRFEEHLGKGPSEQLQWLLHLES